MNTPEFIHGCIAPTFTAWTDTGEFDEAGQRHLLDYLVERGGISCFFVRAGMGQMYTFNLEEARALTRVACDHLGGRVPVIVGCNGIWNRDYDRRPEPKQFLRESIELSRFAEDCGADGIVHTVPEALLPHANETMPDLFVRFYADICGVLKIPVIIYQPPNTRDTYQMAPSTVRRLSDISGLAGAKVSYSDAKYLFELIRAVKDKPFQLIPGDERAWYAGLFAGARAVIGQGAILNPQVLNAVQNRFDAGDIEGACEAQEDVNRLCAACPNPQDFLARRVRESGRQLATCLRTAQSNLYQAAPTPLSDDEYQTFRRLLEEMDEKYLLEAGA